MNICIYGASSNEIDKSYMDAVELLGQKMAERSHTLVFGAGGAGLMGAAARGVTKGGGKIIGVIPTFFNVDGVVYDKCTEIVKTATMRERKQYMEEHADAFIMTPGGIGTYDEFFEMVTLKQLARHNRAMIIYNINGYFDDLITMIDNAIKKKFINAKCPELYYVTSSPDDALDYLENYKPISYRTSDFKDIVIDMNDK